MYKESEAVDRTELADPRAKQGGFDGRAIEVVLAWIEHVVLFGGASIGSEEVESSARPLKGFLEKRCLAGPRRDISLNEGVACCIEGRRDGVVSLWAYIGNDNPPLRFRL